MRHVLSAEGIDPREELVKHDSQAEDVGTAIHEVPFASRLFGTHVGGSSHQFVAGIPAEILVPQGNPEIGDIGLAYGIDQDIGRLHVAVNESLRMGIVECFGDDGDGFRRFKKRPRSLLDRLTEITAFDELGEDVTQAVFGPSAVVNGHNVGVVEAGQDPCFRQKLPGVCFVGDSLSKRHLNGDTTRQLFIVREINRGKTA